MLMLLLALLSSLATLFWIFCIGAPDGRGNVIEGRIFSKIGYWLDYKYNQKLSEHFNSKYQEKTKPFKLLSGQNEPRQTKPIIYSILGICFVCTNFWVSILSYLIGVIFLSLSWYHIFTLPLISYGLINLLYSKFYE